MLIQKPLVEGGSSYVELAAGDLVTGSGNLIQVQNNLPDAAGANDFPAGSALKVSSVTPAGFPVVELADASSEAEAEALYAIAVEEITELNGVGYAVCSGAVRLPTTVWDAVLAAGEGGAGLEVGKVYYLSPIAPGRWTKVKTNTPGEVRKVAGLAVHPEVMIFRPEPGALQS